jgi:hypothetical protein
MDEPRRLGDYEILTELATGGVATVYAARHVGDAGFERLVAIKRVHRHLLRDPDVFASLADEARISALVEHPNVVATHEVLDQKGELCLVQQYVEGVSLALLHKRAAQRADRRDGHGEGDVDRRLPVEVVARIAIDFLRGLHAAHEAVDLRGAPLELVHRDVSPQNVLVGVDGVSRLIDFGIARAEGRITETRGGILKGKLAYMAPEQVGEREVDRRADLFAAGVVIYELLAGERPFDGVGDAESMARILAADADPTKVEARSPELAPIVARALAREPRLRWATAEELAEAIAEAIRPASDAAMRALVKELAGDLLAERREAIREELGRAEEEAIAAADPPAPLAAPSPERTVADDERDELPARPGPSRAVVAVLSVGALAVVVALLASFGDRDPPVVDTSPPVLAAPAGGREAPVLAPQPDSPSPLGSPTIPATSAPTPRAIVLPALPPASTRSAAPAPSAAPSSRPELHGNPYGR